MGKLLKSPSTDVVHFKMQFSSSFSVKIQLSCVESSSALSSLTWLITEFSGVSSVTMNEVLSVCCTVLLEEIAEFWKMLC